MGFLKMKIYIVEAEYSTGYKITYPPLFKTEKEARNCVKACTDKHKYYIKCIKINNNDILFEFMKSINLEIMTKYINQQNVIKTILIE